jgi:hypothetical protein
MCSAFEPSGAAAPLPEGEGQRKNLPFAVEVSILTSGVQPLAICGGRLVRRARHSEAAGEWSALEEAWSFFAMENPRFLGENA